MILTNVARTASLSYDPLGRLWQTSNAVHGTTRFLYDGDRLAAEYDMAGAIRRRYAWGQGVDQPVLRHEGGALSCAGTRFLHTDHQGSIIATADCPGNRLNVNSYDDYGVPGAGNWGRFQYSERPRPARGGWPSRAAQAWLPELGMYSYKPVLSEVEGARIYSPQLGAPCCPRAPHAGAAALMQTDPIGYEDQMNLYAYVANDPVNNVDPDGGECAQIIH